MYLLSSVLLLETETLTQNILLRKKKKTACSRCHILRLMLTPFAEIGFVLMSFLKALTSTMPNIDTQTSGQNEVMESSFS